MTTKITNYKINDDGTVSYTVTERPNIDRIQASLDSLQERKATLQKEMADLDAQIARLQAIVDAARGSGSEVTK